MPDSAPDTPIQGTRTRSRLGRLVHWLREPLAILAAILVAFALDAWWEERREQEQMRDALDAVAVEIERNLVLLDEALAFNRVQAAKGFEVVQLTPEQVEALPEDEALRLGSFPEFNLVSLELGAITAFIEGAFLAVVPDRELRAELAAIPRLQPEMDEEAMGLMDAQDLMASTMTEALPMEEMIGLFRDPRGAGRSLLRGVAINEAARRALLGRSFYLGRLYADELEETRAQLGDTLSEIRRFERD